MKKKKQHYVWRKYLRAWSKNETIYCHRENKIYIAELMAVGSENYFYKLKELSEPEIEVVRGLGLKNAPEALVGVLNNFIDIFTIVFTLRNKIRSAGTSTADMEEKIEELIVNTEEDLHAEIERQSNKYIDRLLAQDIGFYEDEQDRMDFLYYMSVQYVRTKKMKHDVISTIGEIPQIDAESVWNVLKHMYATLIARSILHKGGFHLVILENNTATPFITGDQPVINTFAISKEPGSEVVDLEFYYPLSPLVSILLTNQKHYVSTRYININEESVKKFNSDIISESHEQIYAESVNTLEQLFPKAKIVGSAAAEKH